MGFVVVEDIVFPHGGAGAGFALVCRGSIVGFRRVFGAPASNEPKRSDDRECAALHHVGVTFRLGCLSGKTFAVALGLQWKNTNALAFICFHHRYRFRFVWY